MTTLTPTPFTLLAAIDYSETSSLVVEHAVELARQRDAVELHFLHVTTHRAQSEEEREAMRDELLEWLGARLQDGRGFPGSVKIVGHQAGGDPAEVIVDMAGDLLADVVIVGTHGRKGVQRMVLGSVSESVVRNCKCPVLVVRAKSHHEQPQIEPPCPRCVETRAQTGGAELWCEQHREKHGRRHTYYNPRSSSWVSHRMMP